MLTDPERSLAEALGEAVGRDLILAYPTIRDRVALMVSIDDMPGVEPGTGKIAANGYIDQIIRTIEELRP